MDCSASYLAYKDTGYFTKIILDYIDNNKILLPFYEHPVSIEGMKAAIHNREQFKTDRKLLVNELKKQYSNVESAVAVNNNLEKLLQENTFTITTAHQPAIFTGTLFFVYKILHAIKLAEHLAKEFPQNNFAPVYYMGSEDADLDELGKIFIDSEKIVWDTKQTGAIGRMNTKGLEKIIARIEGEFSIKPFGNELIQLLKDCYLNSADLQTATFKLVHALFAEFGLIVLIPDNAAFKRAMLPIFEEDLFHQIPSGIVEKTITELSNDYKVQANPREINLFYLKDNLRGRIEKAGDKFIIHDSTLSFDEKEMKEELQKYPERFSPNVILRGIFQETILPNIAFIGGGGEMAYWLELKNLFANYKVPYPMLILRNSFLIIEKKWKEKLSKLRLTETNIFKSAEELINDLVKGSSTNQLSLEKELADAKTYYDKVKNISNKVDVTLAQHVESLQARALKPLQQLEKKLLRAEKRKFEEHQKQIQSLKSALFPLNNLQERIDNFMPYYAKWGREFISILYENSLALEQQFVALEEK
jgi:bacillithiol biosynthesis cysteine-adding enzyme BshC